MISRFTCPQWFVHIRRLHEYPQWYVSNSASDYSRRIIKLEQGLYLMTSRMLRLKEHTDWGFVDSILRLCAISCTLYFILSQRNPNITEFNGVCRSSVHVLWSWPSWYSCELTGIPFVWKASPSSSFTSSDLSTQKPAILLSQTNPKQSFENKQCSRLKAIILSLHTLK